jgi:hypothetical protein
MGLKKVSCAQDSKEGIKQVCGSFMTLQNRVAKPCVLHARNPSTQEAEAGEVQI